MQQQHAPVPQSRPFALLGREMAVDVCAAGLRERPDPWLDGDLDRINRGDLNHVKLHQWTLNRYARTYV